VQKYSDENCRQKFAKNTKRTIIKLIYFSLFPMELIEMLTKHHFSEKEAKVYLACLQLKIANISTIARFTQEKRSTTYSVVKELQKKGILNEIDKNKIASYSAVPPEALIKTLESQIESFKELLPFFVAITEKF
jgi:sugar-specific transcriptional regulator TrmB